MFLDFLIILSKAKVRLAAMVFEPMTSKIPGTAMLEYTGKPGLSWGRISACVKLRSLHNNHKQCERKMDDCGNANWFFSMCDCHYIMPALGTDDQKISYVIS